MDFLKSAVASAISKTSAFPYSFDDRVDIDTPIWSLHSGTKRVEFAHAKLSRAIADKWTVQEDGSKCSIFSFDVVANRSKLPLARNALRKFRTLRHPGLIKVHDTFEVRSNISSCIAYPELTVGISLTNTFTSPPNDSPLYRGILNGKACHKRL
jgi:SCY1-like protein 1